MRRSPRALVAARLDGGISALVSDARRLAAPSSSPAAPSALALVLADLAGALGDVDCALQTGAEGAHDLLARLVLHPDDDVRDAAAECVGECASALPPGLAFPLRRREGHPPAPISFQFQAHATDSAAAAGALSKPLLELLGVSAPSACVVGPASAARLRSSVSRVLTRAIPSWVRRQTSQEDVGQLLWPAALPMSRWIVAHAALLRGKRVLEIGSGMGLCGIVAALAKAAVEGEEWEEGEEGEEARGVADDGSRTTTMTQHTNPVYLTDFNDVVLHNLEYNAVLNEPCLNPEAFPSGLCLPPLPTPPAAAADDDGRARRLMRVSKADWSGLFHPLRPDKASTGRAEEVGDSTADVQSPPFSSPSSSSAVRNVDDALAAHLVFDVILGSDMICSKEDALGVAALLRDRLVVGGFAALMLAPPDVRWGVDALPAAIAAAGGGLALVAVETVRPKFASGPEGEVTKPADMPEVSVAGGYEARLQLVLVTRR
jgi:hypothetical protein